MLARRILRRSYVVFMVSCFLTVDEIALSGDKNILLQTGPTAPIGYHPCGPSARAIVSPLQLWRWALQREVTCQVAWLTGMAPFLEQSYTLNTCGVAGPQALAREDKPGITGLGQCWDLGSMANRGNKAF